MDTKKIEILAYLQGPRRYTEGVELYAKYGDNKTLAQTLLRRGVTNSSRDMLMEELRKTAGISEAEFKRIRQQATTPKVTVPEVKAVVEDVVTDDTVQDTGEGKEQTTPSATTVKVIRFREKFPFLNEDDCPDVLKILVADMLTAYGKYKEAHVRLTALPDDADALEAARLSEEVVENFINNRDIWEELEYYQEHRELLGKCDKVKVILASKELSALDDMELMKKRQSAAAQVSKAKKIVEDSKADKEKKAAAAKTLEEWTSKKEALEKEIESRKKK